MPTKTYSTQQNGAPITGSTLMKVSTGPCIVFDIEGEVDSTTGTAYYIQLLGTAAPASGPTVPLYSRLCVLSGSATGKNGFSFVYRPIGLDTAAMLYPEVGNTAGNNVKSVYVAISSTDNVWTSVAANTQVSVTVEETYIEDVNTVIVGDLTTGVEGLVVYPNGSASAASRLLQFIASNSEATINAPRYLMLFAQPPVNGLFPVEQWQFNNSAQKTFKFSNHVYAMQKGTPTLNAPATDFTQWTGLYLYGSTTSGYYTATTGTKWNVQAWCNITP